MLEVRENAPGMLQVLGSVDLTSVSDLRENLVSAVDRAVTDGLPVLTIDLSGAEMVDAAGLGVLLGAHRRARRGGSSLRLVRLTPELHRVLLVSRLYRVLDIEPDDIEPDDAGSGAAGTARAETGTSAPAESVPEPRGETSNRRPLTPS